MFPPALLFFSFSFIFLVWNKLMEIDLVRASENENNKKLPHSGMKLVVLWRAANRIYGHPYQMEPPEKCWTFYLWGISVSSPFVWMLFILLKIEYHGTLFSVWYLGRWFHYKLELTLLLFRALFNCITIGKMYLQKCYSHTTDVLQ